MKNSWQPTTESAPKLPGVYWFLNKNAKILYVGKAKNLKDRLASYRHITKKDIKTSQMLSLAKNVKHQTTDSELEAILIEAELIKIHQPKFNLCLKDDKSPLYIYLTSDPFPGVKTGRKELLDNLKIKAFNQFGPFPSGYQTTQVLKFVRRIFPFCSATTRQKKLNQACFYSHLGLCPGACTGKISLKNYQKNISNLKLFLRGKKPRVLTRLKNQMKNLSLLKDFEAAAKVRDQIKMIKNLQLASTQPELNLPQLLEDQTQEKLLQLSRVLRRYQALPKTYPLTRIEAYDISNISGKSATGSMVVFANGLPQSSQYRHFKIKHLKTPNDPKMLSQVLSRRVKHTNWPIPNLIVIDGGRGQLNAALKVIPWTIPVISIVKGPDRLLIPGRSKIILNQVSLNRYSQALKLIQHLRDESHRFAQRLHKNLRQKKLLI